MSDWEDVPDSQGWEDVRPRGFNLTPRDYSAIGSSALLGLIPGAREVLTYPREFIGLPNRNPVANTALAAVPPGIPRVMAASGLSAGGNLLNLLMKLGRVPYQVPELAPPSANIIPQPETPQGAAIALPAELATSILSGSLATKLSGAAPRLASAIDSGAENIAKTLARQPVVEYFNPLSTRTKQIELAGKYRNLERGLEASAEQVITPLQKKAARAESVFDLLSEKYKPGKQSVPDFLNSKKALIEDEIKNLAFEAPEIAKTRAEKLVGAGNKAFGDALENIDIQTTKGDVLDALENSIDEIGGSRDIVGSGPNKIDAIIKRIGKYDVNGVSKADLEEIVDNKFISDLTKEISRSTDSRDTAIVYNYLMENLSETAPGLKELKASHRNIYRIAKESKLLTPTKIKQVAAGKVGSKELQVLSGAEKSLGTNIVSTADRLNKELDSVISEINSSKIRPTTESQKFTLSKIKQYQDAIDEKINTLTKYIKQERKILSDKKLAETEMLAKELMRKKIRLGVLGTAVVGTGAINLVKKKSE